MYLLYLAENDLLNEIKLAVTELAKSFKWSPKNCVLMYKPIAKRFDALGVTFLFNPNTHEITFQVLYDHLLSEPVVSNFSIFENYENKSKTAKANFEESSKRTKT